MTEWAIHSLSTKSARSAPKRPFLRNRIRRRKSDFGRKRRILSQILALEDRHCLMTPLDIMCGITGTISTGAFPSIPNQRGVVGIGADFATRLFTVLRGNTHVLNLTT